jgi:uncharacterized membrane protein YccF (DUF307 family)
VRLIPYSTAVENGVVGILVGGGLIILSIVCTCIVFGLPAILSCLVCYSTMVKSYNWISVRREASNRKKMEKKQSMGNME